MQEINPVNHSVSASLSRPAAASAYRAGSQPTARPSDKVELSDMAQMLSRLAQFPDVRQDLVERIRRQIADGSYETPEKLDTTVQNLLDDLSQ